MIFLLYLFSKRNSLRNLGSEIILSLAKTYNSFFGEDFGELEFATVATLEKLRD